MTEHHVDVAIIGAGTAGMGAYRRVREHTDKVVLIENQAYGTTCARVGCMPSKLLIAAAEAAHHIGTAPAFGVHPAGPSRIDGREVMARVRSERDRFVGFVVDTVESWPEAQRLWGHARFVDANTLLVGEDTRVQFQRVVIATGSSPAIPPPFRGAGDRLIVNDDIFDWEDLPDSVAVFGPGVIGLELGQALHRLGVRVRVFGRGGAVGPLSDPAVRERCQRLLGAEFPLHPDAEVREIRREAEQVVIEFLDAQGQTQQEHFDYLLAATGRRPNLHNLDLEKTGLELDDRGMPNIDPYTLQAGELPIFIPGDANAHLPLLHEAADEGRIAGDNAARWPEVRAGQRRSPLAVVFTDPQIAMVGSRFADLDADGYAVGEVDFAGQGRSRVILKNRGLLRVYAAWGTGKFLGAEMVGPAAEHLAHLLAWSHQQGLTVNQMLEMPFYHPVIEEGLRSALRDASHAVKTGPAPVPGCLDCGPGS